MSVTVTMFNLTYILIEIITILIKYILAQELGITSKSYRSEM